MLAQVVETEAVQALAIIAMQAMGPWLLFMVLLVHPIMGIVVHAVLVVLAVEVQEEETLVAVGVDILVEIMEEVLPKQAVAQVGWAVLAE